MACAASWKNEVAEGISCGIVHHGESQHEIERARLGGEKARTSVRAYGELKFAAAR
jgi:hypothetical protein